ncbi:F0F1 ATP synthase subunit A [Pseudoclavibacter soli]|uniref:F0F1 ATP synthase subunit A n=1 Tax=Pseudoclavibacter soli TaxID=452623 RepID=UPI00040856FD|nr:F0F1 ATP synthase subunit A [Pseudoclavibacter soli]
MTHALTPLTTSFVAADGEFHAPSISEFFPDAVFFAGTPFELNRIGLIRIVVAIAIVLVLWLGTRKLKLVPGRGQSLLELLYDFIRVNIAEDMLGKKDGQRFVPLLFTIFVVTLGFNITGIIPGFNIAVSSTIGFPLVLAVVAYIVFIYAGIKKNGLGYFKAALFPAGVPKLMYVLVTPIEFLSTFIIRPVSLTLRLLMNMVAGHLILVLCFSATWFFLFSAGGLFTLIAPVTFAFGFAFTLFELLVAVLQAYIFTLLTTAYIQSSLAEEH